MPVRQTPWCVRCLHTASSLVTCILTSRQACAPTQPHKMQLMCCPNVGSNYVRHASHGSCIPLWACSQCNLTALLTLFAVTSSCTSKAVQHSCITDQRHGCHAVGVFSCRLPSWLAATAAMGYQLIVRHTKSTKTQQARGGMHKHAQARPRTHAHTHTYIHTCGRTLRAP